MQSFGILMLMMRNNFRTQHPSSADSTKTKKEVEVKRRNSLFSASHYVVIYSVYIVSINTHVKHQQLSCKKVKKKKQKCINVSGFETLDVLTHLWRFQCKALALMIKNFPLLFDQVSPPKEIIILLCIFCLNLAISFLLLIFLCILGSFHLKSYSQITLMWVETGN